MPLQISVPERIAKSMKQQMASRGYGDPGEYVAALIEAEQHRALRAELEEKLLEAARQPSSPMLREDWDRIRHEGRRILVGRGRQ